jgi:hypothetical protein
LAGRLQLNALEAVLGYGDAMNEHVWETLRERHRLYF